MKNIQYSKIPPSTTKIIAKGNSSESNHYIPVRDIEALKYVVADKFGLTFVLSDISTLTKNATRQLPLSSSLSYIEKKESVLDNLKNSMILLGKLCDENFQVVLDKINLYAFKNEKIIPQVNISRSGKVLWEIPITMQNKST